MNTYVIIMVMRNKIAYQKWSPITSICLWVKLLDYNYLTEQKTRKLTVSNPFLSIFLYDRILFLTCIGTIIQAYYWKITKVQTEIILLKKASTYIKDFFFLDKCVSSTHI